MLAAIKLVISENEKLLDTVTKETATGPSQLIGSLQEFQKSANTILTKLIGEEEDEAMSCSEGSDEEKNKDETPPKKKK